jgi:hypothetical protein
MILEVICKESFNMPIFSGVVYFIKGKKYKYNVDFLERICDEQIYHIIDNHIIPPDVFKSKFTLLEDWRDDQLNNLI